MRNLPTKKIMKNDLAAVFVVATTAVAQFSWNKIKKTPNLPHVDRNSLNSSFADLRE
jgi:hypothetical protein